MSKTRVLLVDNNSRYTHLLRANLESLGRFEVKEENCAPHAVATALDFRPDLILLDVMMPVMDGGALAARIRDVPALRNTPVVFLTALIDPTEEPGHCEPMVSKNDRLERLVATIDEQIGLVGARH